MNRDDLVAVLGRQGITNRRVLAAIGDVDRSCFLPPERADQAWENNALQIGHGQTISQPFIVAYMTQALGISPGDKVLEIGTGSGYQAAILAACGARVWSIEVIPELAKQAAAAFQAAGITGVTQHVGQGRQGWPGPGDAYQAIIVTAASPDTPPALLDQLALPTNERRGGRLILPLKDERGNERLVLIERTAAGTTEEKLIGVRFVALV